MFKVHGFLKDVRVINRSFQHLPRCGDTVRLSETRYVKVTEVIWAFDEDDSVGQRVNLRLKDLIKGKKPNAR